MGVETGEEEQIKMGIQSTNKSSNGSGGGRSSSKPTWMRQGLFKVTRVMSYRPILCCGSCCSFILLVVVIALAAGLAGFATPSDYDWTIAASTESENADALADAREQVDQLQSSGTRKQNYDSNMFFLFDLGTNEDLYQAEYLKQMCDVESVLALDPDYPKYCRLDDDDACTVPQSSIVAWFYEFETIDQWVCTLLDESYVSTKKDILYSAMETEGGAEAYGLWLEKSAPSKGYTTKCNSVWSFGAPLEGYDSPSDNESKQRDEYTKFLGAIDGTVDGVEADLFKYFGVDDNADNFFPYYPSPYMTEASKKDIEVMWMSGLLFNNETTRVLNGDLLFAIFSIIFVLFWIRVHTKSSFIAAMGMYMIFMSLPFSLVIYSGIYQIPYFDSLHSLVLFIVLGVGADDVFVLVDSWRQTEHMFPGDIKKGVNRHLVHKRLLHCYEHTMATVFNTSFTTATAFIATGFSPLMPISTFGWYAATCIVMNYIFVITLMPPAVVIADMYFAECWCCPSKDDANNDHQEKIRHQSPEGSVVDVNEQQPQQVSKAGEAYGAVSSDDEAVADGATGGVEGLEMVAIESKNATLVHGDDADLDDASERFDHVDNERETDFKPNSLVEAYIKFLSFSVRVPCSLLNSSSSECEGATAAPVPTSEALVDPETGKGTEGEHDRNQQDLDHDSTTKGTIVPIVAALIAIGLLSYGIVGVTYGTKLTPPTEQESWYPAQHMFTRAMDSVTNDFLSAEDNAYATLFLTFGIKGIDRKDYDIYVPAKNRGDAVFDNNWQLAEPMCQQAMIRMCDEVQDYDCGADGCKPAKKLARINTTECFMRDYREYMDEKYGIDTYTMNAPDFYSNLSYYRETEFRKFEKYGSWQDLIGFIDGELKFGTVKLTLTMEAFSEMLIKQEVLDVIKDFRKKVRSYSECDTCDCSSLMYSDQFSFTWMRSEEGLVSGFYQGLMIAFPVSFCVLLFATGNLISSLYAILSVFFIVFSVLGFVNYGLGWNLGIAESIAGIIIIGFAVDYTVHLGHMYAEGEKHGIHTRKAKVEFTARKIALTIVGGAITTVGAGVFMFACQLVFFQKMATLIVATILMSYLYSLGFFMSVLYTIGPVNKQGDLKAMWTSVKSIVDPSAVNASKVTDTSSVENSGTREAEAAAASSVAATGATAGDDKHSSSPSNDVQS